MLNSRIKAIPVVLYTVLFIMLLLSDVENIFLGVVSVVMIIANFIFAVICFVKFLSQRIRR